MTCLVPSSKASLKSLVLLVAGELVAKLGDLKVILATNRQVVELAGGQLEEVVVFLLDVAREVDRQAGAEAMVAVVEEDRLAGERSSAIGV